MKTKLCQALALLLCVALFLCLIPTAFAENAESLTIPDGVTVIEAEAFSGCESITQVIIPAGVTRIGYGAFEDCRNLLEVRYNGLPSQWDAINFGEQNDSLFHSAIRFGNGQYRVPIHERFFPDEQFRKYVQTFDLDDNQVLNEVEIDAVTAIDVSSGSVMEPGPVKSLKGLEFYRKLETLICFNNQLTELDLHDNSALKTLACGLSFNGFNLGNSLTELDLSGCPDLLLLLCDNNQLEHLDLSGNPSLRTLACGNNLLDELIISDKPDLEYLDCANNGLSGLDVSANAKLTELYCGHNKLRALDLSGNTSLRAFNCDYNGMETLILGQNVYLFNFGAMSNNLSELDVSGLPNLQVLGCGNNQLTEIDLSHNPILNRAHIWSNQLIELDISHNPCLFFLDVRDNLFDTLDISPAKNLVNLVSDPRVVIEEKSYHGHLYYYYTCEGHYVEDGGQRMNHTLTVDKNVNLIYESESH